MASDGNTTDPTAQISVDTASPEKIVGTAIDQTQLVSLSEIADQTTAEQSPFAPAPESGNDTVDHDAPTKTNGFSANIAHSQEDSEEPTAKRIRVSEDQPEEEDHTDKTETQMSIDTVAQEPAQVEPTANAAEATAEPEPVTSSEPAQLGNAADSETHIAEAATPPRPYASAIETSTAMDISPLPAERTAASIIPDADSGNPVEEKNVEEPKTEKITAMETATTGVVAASNATSSPVPVSSASKHSLSIDTSSGHRVDLLQPVSIMTKEQNKYCTAMIRALKKHRDAGPFLNPVDIVALNIPDYPTIVTKPIDLGTIEKKLKVRQYADTQAFIDDLRLMFNNCYMYNGRESV
ncbi:hypothetical protein LPJ57_008960, partial [Coemansia sp. RSA 486]